MSKELLTDAEFASRVGLYVIFADVLDALECGFKADQLENPNSELAVTWRALEAGYVTFCELVQQVRTVIDKIESEGTSDE